MVRQNWSVTWRGLRISFWGDFQSWGSGRVSMHFPVLSSPHRGAGWGAGSSFSTCDFLETTAHWLLDLLIVQAWETGWMSASSVELRHSATWSQQQLCLGMWECQLLPGKVMRSWVCPPERRNPWSHGKLGSLGAHGLGRELCCPFPNREALLGQIKNSWISSPFWVFIFLSCDAHNIKKYWICVPFLLLMCLLSVYFIVPAIEHRRGQGSLSSLTLTCMRAHMDTHTHSWPIVIYYTIILDGPVTAFTYTLWALSSCYSLKTHLQVTLSRSF